MRRLALCTLSALALARLVADTASPSPAAPAESPAAEKTVGLPPTLADQAYGDHPRQQLNFWRADSDRPAPVVIHMHGGGWTGGDRKKSADKDVDAFLAAGISYVSFSYRYIQQAREARITPPVQWPMSDAARVVQFVRSKAAEWNIDKSRVAMTGTSAGACSSLWVAFHDDMADPASPDPVARESTRLWCVAVNDAQTSLDPAQMKEWTPNSLYGGHAFGFNSGKAYEARVAAFAKFLEKRESVLSWIREYSPYVQATRDDPPVYLHYGNWPEIGKTPKDPTHTANFGVKLKERLDQIGIPCELVHRGVKNPARPSSARYLIESLRAPDSASAP